ncbi:MAG: type II toxin-antitoxin system RelE/ParE family toxin [Mariprofundaceae bacterium]|nr:type II toxin-antitoxin system RelE/ParE family toxin [Mariprofundaceae bacterium]
MADNSYKNALDVMERIREKAIFLEGFPLIGDKSDIEGVYRLMVSKTSCSILYSVDKEVLNVLRIIHQKQRWPLSLDDEKNNFRTSTIGGF